MKYLIKFIIKTIALFIIAFPFQVICQEETEDNSNPAKLKKHVTFLSSDEMQGRYPGTDENIKAGNYIIDKFREFGLKNVDNTYFQKFKFIDTLNIGEKNDVTFKVLIRKPGVPENMLRKRKKSWTVSNNWLPMGFSKNGSVEGELVFCGYGITSKELGYDDYANIDVKDKIVIVLADSAAGKPVDYFWTPFSDLSYKVENAKKHGASAIIFIKVQHDSANVFFPLDIARKYKSSEMIAIHANRTNLAKFFPKKKPLIKVELGINKSKKPNSFILPDVSVSISVEVNKVEKEISNIIGYIEGTDPELKHEFIVLGAHFDGLGAFWFKPKWHPREWAVNNSADANASGVSALLELASRIANNPLKRSVAFIAFNAGVIEQAGSKYYIQNPILPIEKTNFMLNLDAIGKMRNNRVFALGANTSSIFTQILHKASSEDSTLNIIQAKDCTAPSDYIPFYQKNIPLIMLFTGSHTDLNSKTDISDKINYEGIDRIVNLSENILREIDDFESKPKFQVDPTVIDFRAIKKGYRCWLGVCPDYEVLPQGMKIAEVFKYSPANKANIKSGDIILRFNGKNINSFYDLQSQLRLAKPGEKIKVDLLRKDKEKSITVKMAQKK